MAEPPNKKKSRNAEIMNLQADGLSYREIAAAMGISRSRVGAIVKRERSLALRAAFQKINEDDRGKFVDRIIRAWLRGKDS